MNDPTFVRASHAPAFFGKLPSALDFVRIHHDYPDAVSLDRWLTLGLQRLAACGLGWPVEPLRFVFVPAGSETALLGVVCASRDRAGRQFPIAIFAGFTPATELAALPLACADFLQRAEDLLARAGSLTALELGTALTRLPMPDASDLRAARAGLQLELAELTLESFAAAHFCGSPAAAVAAFERVLAATARGACELVFDCPIAAPRDGAIWSLLAAHALGRAPSCLWGADRLLLALGPLPERAPLYWAAKTRRHAQLCTLTTGPVCPSDVNAAQPLGRLLVELTSRAL